MDLWRILPRLATRETNRLHDLSSSVREPYTLVGTNYNLSTHGLPEPLIGPPEMFKNSSFEFKTPRRSISTAIKTGSSKFSDGFNEERAVSSARPHAVSWCFSSIYPRSCKNRHMTLERISDLVKSGWIS